MAIILVTPDLVGPVKNGGIGTACYHYARSLALAGYDVSILFTSPSEPRDDEKWKSWYLERGITLFTLADVAQPRWPLHMDWALSRSHNILNFLRLRAFKYIIFQDWQANGFWATRAKSMNYALGGAKIGLIAHSPTEWQKQGMENLGDNPLADAVLEWGEKEALAGADILISPSRHMIDWLSSNGYTLPAEVALCPYTFEDDVGSANPKEVDRTHLIFFGRLETRKGLHLLSDALRSLKRTKKVLPKTVSLLGKYASVQGVPSKRYIDRLRSDLPEIDIRVKTDLDYKDALDYIRRANGIVVIPSTLDNLPLTVIESINNGLAFIASNVGGIPEMADAAVLFEATVEGLRDVLERLNRIDFSAVRHVYSPANARRTWLAHVDEQLSRPSLPTLRVPSERGVSVCIPFYKADRFVGRLIGSFLQSRDPDLQLVFVNDGTPEEECADFLRYKTMLEPHGHVFHVQENAGPGAARNRAAELARHDKLIFFDADNVPFPTFVPSLRQALERGRADSVCAPFVAVPYLDRQPTPSDSLYSYIFPGGPLVGSLIYNSAGDTCSIQRRAVFEALGGFTTDRSFYYEDWYYFLKLIGNNYRHLVFPEPLFFYGHDPEGRRTVGSEYSRMTRLWKVSEEIDREQLAASFQILTKHAFVQVRRPSAAG